MIFFSTLREFVICLQPFIVFLTGCFTAWLLFKTRPRRFQKLEITTNSVIINWSGHPLPDADWLESYQVWTPEKMPYFNTDSWDTIRASVHTLLKQLPQDILYRLYKGEPNVIIVIPQLGAGLAILLAVLHGENGCFPVITCPLKREGAGGFWLPEPIRLGDLRMDSRRRRDLKDIQP